jgi:fatty-acyl-CoA synthase
MYVRTYAQSTPDKPAVIHARSGASISYRELDERSCRLARLLRAEGLARGDHVAIFMENNLRFMEVLWAAFRSGLYITAINRYLTAEEAAYIVVDCGAKAIVTSKAMEEVATAMLDAIPKCRLRLMVDGTAPGWQAYESAVAWQSSEPLADESLGDSMLYSSGTTGRPKGIKRPLLPAPGFADWRGRLPMSIYGFDADTVYLTPAPLYHSAPLAYSIAQHFFGGTLVFMDKFDPLEALEAIDRYKVTHSQWVPTMFVRFLRLTEEERRRFDLSSHKVAIHAAAPCPVEVKRQMIAWWGPILQEYYAGTEANGVTRITSEEWLARPGSVGQAKIGIIHICDDEGTELPAGEAGTIYFERDVVPFIYHNDDAKTKSVQHPHEAMWTTLGDVGYVDKEGYLFLTDRKAFMIISGGVNIYPQAIEDALILHPKVGDVAVFGVPNAEMGEEVKAIIEPAAGVAPSPALAEELIAFAREKVGRYMVPRSIDFIDEMPRLPTGKLYKRVLRDKYWKAAK